jgi:hypothetical protein
MRYKFKPDAKNITLNIQSYPFRSKTNGILPFESWERKKAQTIQLKLP